MQEPPRASAGDRRFWVAFAACAAAALVPLWIPKYLPMVDLPQHAVQVSAWLHLDDPSMGFADQFELHLFTPYLLPYLLAMLLTKVVGLLPALKLLVTLAVVGLPLATLRLVSRRGGDPWWALWGFPLAFGISFYWGFVNYIVTVPLGILLVDEGDAYAREPTRGRGARLAALGVALFFSHLLVLVACLGVVATLAASRARREGRWLVRFAPHLPIAAISLAWIVAATAHGAGVSDWRWRFSWTRLTLLPQHLFDAPLAVELGQPDLDHGASTMAWLLTVALLLSRPRPSREPADWIPVGLLGAAYLFGPSTGFSGGLLSDRFAIFVVPFLLAALREVPGVPARGFARALTVGAAVAWMAVLAVRFDAFDRVEMAPAERVWRHMEPNRRVTTLVYSPRSRFAHGAEAFIHVAAWAQAERGGTLDTSFARLVNLPIQYRPGREPQHTVGLDLHPEQFSWNPDGGADYFLVQAPPPGWNLFARAPDPVVLVAREGDWWLYRHLRPAGGAAAQSGSRL